MLASLLGSIVLAVAGHPVATFCEGSLVEPAAGSYSFQSKEINLDPWVCRSLRRGPEATYFGAALIILAHEASHAAGIGNESRAQCNALFSIPALLRPLELERWRENLIRTQVADYNRALPAPCVTGYHHRRA